jgi:hypothetical protein
MAVQLHVKGERLDIKQFSATTGLLLHNEWYEMMETVKKHSTNSEQETPTAVMEISKALQSIETDIENTIEYLRFNKSKLDKIFTIPEVEYGAIYFMSGIYNCNTDTRTSMIHFPSDLLRLAADSFLDLLVLSYFPDEQDDQYDDLLTKPRFFA